MSKCFVNLNICFFLYRLFNIFVDLFIFLFIHLFIYYLALLSIYLFHMKNDGMSSFGRNHNYYIWLCERVVAVHKFHKAKFIFTFVCQPHPPPLKKKKGLERTVPPSFCKPLNNLKTILNKISISLVLLHILGGKN